MIYVILKLPWFWKKYKEKILRAKKLKKLKKLKKS
jgi:hypothetical protein